jgi:protocatechuate 3,4-dioxygenase beta subunit
LRAGLGAIGAAVLAACSKTPKTSAAAGSTPTSPTPSTPTGPTTTPAQLNCVVTPEKTEGPYFVDERLNRSDIRPDPSTGEISAGAPLLINVRVWKVDGQACNPLEGAQVDLWHADASGSYSDVGQTQGQKFLRGYQLTDAGGIARFTTVYPGWYQGRAVHIHFKVRTFSGGQRSSEFTSQWFFTESTTGEVYRDAPYSSRGKPDTPNSRDNIYASNGDELTVTVAKSGGTYAANYDIGIART